MAAMLAAFVEAYVYELSEHAMSASTLYKIKPENADMAYQNKVIFYVHGGGFTMGGGMASAYAAVPLAHRSRLSVYSIDYRMPPDHPFPCGLNDTVEAYKFVLSHHKPENIVVVGTSAGGGMAASLMLKARDEGLAMPAALVLQTPEIDLTESGDTFTTNDTIDVVLKHRLTESIALYADGHDLQDPYLSPIFGDFSKGFPPTILFSGTRDLFLSNTVRMHRALLRAGIEAELHVFEAMPHGGFFTNTIEDKELAEQVLTFIRRKLQL